MVNSGFAILKCNLCKKGCIVSAAINRNQKREENVETQSCEHFDMRISVYTNSNYLAWIAGERDRLSFYLDAMCVLCKKFLNEEVTCVGFETDKGSRNKSCCSNSCIFIYEMNQGFLDPDIVSSLSSFPIIGTLSSSLVTRIENHLKTGRF